LTCLAVCPDANACCLVGERGSGDVVSLYFHGTERHGVRLTTAQRQALAAWLTWADEMTGNREVIAED
jgi:hypothetical protein